MFNFFVGHSLTDIGTFPYDSSSNVHAAYDLERCFTFRYDADSGKKK